MARPTWEEMAEAHGRVFARSMQWDIELCYLMAYACLEEANAHNLAAALKEVHDNSLDAEQSKAVEME